MTAKEQKKAAADFTAKWVGKGCEKGACQKFWRGLLYDVFEIADPDDWVQCKVSVAQTALWIAESQMMIETEKILRRHFEFLSLRRYARIVRGNTLQMGWNALLRDDADRTARDPCRCDDGRAGAVHAKADVPMLFDDVRPWTSDYVAVPYRDSAAIVSKLFGMYAKQTVDSPASCRLN